MKRYFLDKKEALREIEAENRMIGYPDTRNFIVSVIGPRRADKAFSMYGIIKERQLNDGEYVFADLGRRSQNDVGEEKTSPSGPPSPLR